MSEIASAAARAIDKIIRASSLIALHIAEVAQAVRQLLSSPIDIVDKVRVVEGYTFLVSQSINKDEIPQHISNLLEAFGTIDIGSCDSITALMVLKVISAVGKTLYTTSPRKLESQAWTEGHGHEIAEWVRRFIATSSNRFSEDFEIMEVFQLSPMLNIGHH